MMLYIYQISDTEYGAGIGYDVCKTKGKIVEQWPMNTPEQASFVAKRGSAFNGVSPKVTAIASAARQLILEDETFIEHVNRPLVLVPETKPAPPDMWTRAWLGLKGLAS